MGRSGSQRAVWRNCGAMTSERASARATHASAPRNGRAREAVHGMRGQRRATPSSRRRQKTRSARRKSPLGTHVTDAAHHKRPPRSRVLEVGQKAPRLFDGRAHVDVGKRSARHRRFAARAGPVHAHERCGAREEARCEVKVASSALAGKSSAPSSNAMVTASWTLTCAGDRAGMCSHG